jgi:hypothetical protein
MVERGENHHYDHLKQLTIMKWQAVKGSEKTL